MLDATMTVVAQSARMDIPPGELAGGFAESVEVRPARSYGGSSRAGYPSRGLPAKPGRRPAFTCTAANGAWSALPASYALGDSSGSASSRRNWPCGDRLPRKSPAAPPLVRALDVDGQ